MQFFAQNFSQVWINFSFFFQTWVMVRTLVFEVFLLFVVVLLGLRCRKLLPVLFGSEIVRSNNSITHHYNSNNKLQGAKKDLNVKFLVSKLTTYCVNIIVAT